MLHYYYSWLQQQNRSSFFFLYFEKDTYAWDKNPLQILSIPHVWTSPLVMVDIVWNYQHFIIRISMCLKERAANISLDSSSSLNIVQARIFQGSGRIFWIFERYFIQIKIRFICYSDRSHRITDRNSHCSNRYPWGCLLHQGRNCAQGRGGEKMQIFAVHIILPLCNREAFHLISPVWIKSQSLNVSETLQQQIFMFMYDKKKNENLCLSESVFNL